MQTVEKECGCTQVKFLDIVEGYKPCEGQGKKCMTELIDKMGSIRKIGKCKFKHMFTYFLLHHFRG